MALLYALGSALVDRKELLARRAAGDFAKLNARGFASGPGLELRFDTGVMRVPQASAAAAAAAPVPVLDDAGKRVLTAAGDPLSFEPIGLNRPLTVAIREVYAGRFPKFPAFDRSLLVASAVKGTEVYTEAPRAVNVVRQGVARGDRFRVFDATGQGTPYVFHTPALTKLATTVTVELNFGGFPKEFTDSVGTILSSAGAIPIFAPASPYLLAAGIVVKLAGNLAHVLADSGPAELSYSEEVNFVDPGSLLPHAQFVLAVDEREPDFDTLRHDYQVDGTGRLVRADGGQYAGDAPYIIFSLNGAARPDLKDFTPTAATSAQLAKFYNLGDNRTALTDVVTGAFKAASDIALIRRAKDVKARLEAEADPDKKKKLQEELDGIGKSIFDEDLKKLLGL